MEKLLEILEELQPDVDFEKCENLVDGRYLDSLTILSLISEIEDAFDVPRNAARVICQRGIYQRDRKLSQNLNPRFVSAVVKGIGYDSSYVVAVKSSRRGAL